MDKLYFVKDGKCYCKHGSSTGEVGRRPRKAVHVSSGQYDGKDAYAITYDDGEVYMTIENRTSQVRSGSSHLGKQIVSTDFYNGGVLLKFDTGKMYHSYRGGGKEMR